MESHKGEKVNSAGKRTIVSLKQNGQFFHKNSSISAVYAAPIKERDGAECGRWAASAAMF